MGRVLAYGQCWKITWSPIYWLVFIYFRKLAKGRWKDSEELTLRLTMFVDTKAYGGHFIFVWLCVKKMHMCGLHLVGWKERRPPMGSTTRTQWVKLILKYIFNHILGYFLSYFLQCMDNICNRSGKSGFSQLFFHDLNQYFPFSVKNTYYVFW